MKILRTIHSMDPSKGGPVEGTLNSSRELRRRGVSVEIACLDDPSAPFLEGIDLKVHALGPGLGKYGYARTFQQWLDHHVADYDCVIVQGLWQYHGFATRRACIKKRIPYFVFAHGMLSPWFKNQYPLKHLKKWLYWPWGDYRVLRDAQGVFFTTEEEMESSRESFWLYRCNEHVVGYGIEMPDVDGPAQRRSFLSAFPQLEGKSFFLFLSRIHPIKGCDLLIRAFAGVATRHSEWQLVVAGPDQIGWQNGLMNDCLKLGISHKVHWVGMLTGDRKWGAFQACNAFVLPSHHENFGVVVAEALSQGAPVLITDKVSIWPTVKSTGAGLVATDDLEGITQLLDDYAVKIHDGKPISRETARRCFIEHFEIKAAATKLIQTIEQHVH